MCIAIVQKAGASLDAEALWRGWSINGDGAGFAYVDDQDQLQIKKGFLKYNPFHDAYMAAVAQYGKTSPMLVHMRIGTSGGNTEANTHPFPFKPQAGPEGAMIHNGILFTPTGKWVGPKEDLKSDTRVLVESMNNILRLQDVLDAKEALGKAIGMGNKLGFLYANREYVIINEQSGFWKEDIWYSNGSCTARGR